MWWGGAGSGCRGAGCGEFGGAGIEHCGVLSGWELLAAVAGGKPAVVVRATWWRNGDAGRDVVVVKVVPRGLVRIGVEKQHGGT